MNQTPVKKICPAKVGDIVHFVDKELFCAAAIVIAIDSDENAGFMVISPGAMIPIAPGTSPYSKWTKTLEKSTWHLASECECSKRMGTDRVNSRIRLS